MDGVEQYLKMGFILFWLAVIIPTLATLIFTTITWYYILLCYPVTPRRSLINDSYPNTTYSYTRLNTTNSTSVTDKLPTMNIREKAEGIRMIRE